MNREFTSGVNMDMDTETYQQARELAREMVEQGKHSSLLKIEDSQSEMKLTTKKEDLSFIVETFSFDSTHVYLGF